MPEVYFPSLPDNEAALLIAKNEGYTVAVIREPQELENAEPFGLFELHLNGNPVGSFSYLYESQAWAAIPEYCTSLDAADAWLKRMGLEWERRLDKVWIIYVWDKSVGPHAFSHGYGEESNNCSLARAICNAGWQALSLRSAPPHGSPQPVQNPPMIPDWTCMECGSKNPEWSTSETIFGTEHEGHCSECGGELTDSTEVGLRAAIQALDDRRAKLVKQLTVELGHEPCMVCGHEICYEDGDPPLMKCANCHATYDTVAQSVAAQLASKHEIEALQDQLVAKEAGIARLVEELRRETITLNSVRDRRDEFCKELDNTRAELASMTRSRNHYENLYNESQAKLGNTLPKVDILQERVERVEARNEELRTQVISKDNEIAELLAKVEQVRELRVGEMVRLDKYESGRDGIGWTDSEAHLVGKVYPVDKLGCISVGGRVWPRTACTRVINGQEDKDVKS